MHRTDKARTHGRTADEHLMEDSEAVNLAADWADISQGLRKDLGHQLHSQWIKPIQLGALNRDCGTLDLYLPTEFSANWVRDRFHDRLQLAWSIARSEVRKVNIVVPANDGASAIAMAAGALGDATFTSSVGLDASLTFAAFVTGEANILACNAAQRMAALEQPQFSPLYLKAATGQGKTHLLHAIGHGYSFDLLLVDDIQFIIGKASAQEELLYTIDALLAEGKRLVFAADRAPQALDGVEPRLLSRLSMGLVADIQPADIELRKKILVSKLTRFAPLSVPEDVVGGLNKLIAYAQLTGQDVSLQLAEEQLTDILSANRRRITIDEIQRTVCQFYRIDRAEMSSKRRARAVVRPRQVAMYLSKVLTPRSYPEIGRKFGGRDHSTVIHAVRLIEDLRQRDADMDGDVRSLLRQLERGGERDLPSRRRG